MVVVNGPSTDGTAELLTNFAEETRLGTCDVASLGVSRNVAIAMAAGELIAFLDDDAIPPSDWLEQLVPAFADPIVAAAGGPVFDAPSIASMLVIELLVGWISDSTHLLASLSPASSQQ